jgi:hypothetical protein
MNQSNPDWRRHPEGRSPLPDGNLSSERSTGYGRNRKTFFVDMAILALFMVFAALLGIRRTKEAPPSDPQPLRSEASESFAVWLDSLTFDDVRVAVCPVSPPSMEEIAFRFVGQWTMGAEVAAIIAEAIGIPRSLLLRNDEHWSFDFPFVPMDSPGSSSEPDSRRHP